MELFLYSSVAYFVCWYEYEVNVKKITTRVISSILLKEVILHFGAGRDEKKFLYFNGSVLKGQRGWI